MSEEKFHDFFPEYSSGRIGAMGFRFCNFRKFGSKSNGQRVRGT